jgi:hypothetical protein
MGDRPVDTTSLLNLRDSPLKLSYSVLNENDSASNDID